MRTRALLSTLCLVCQPAFGQPLTPDRADAEAARREGTLSWYTSTPVAQAQALANRFEQQTGIKIQLLRTGGQAVLRRLQQVPRTEGPLQRDIPVALHPGR